jgi:aspartyl-tRNA synthetase
MSALATEYRTHTCNELRAAHAGGEAALSGFVDRKVDATSFVIRDRYGKTLVALHPEAFPYVSEVIGKLNREDVVQVRGEVAKRPAEEKTLATGAVVLQAKKIEVLSRADPVPDVMAAPTVAYEDRLTYRQLYLRRPEVQDRLGFRSRVAAETRKHLVAKGFLEIETPQLFLYDSVALSGEIVPASAGRAFQLAGGPLVLNQYVKPGGFDRYFQIQRITTKEDADTPLHAQEYTGLDINMAYADVPDLCAAAEQLLAQLYKALLGVELKTPFLKLSLEDALRRFGTDKVDARFGLELEDVPGGGRGFRVPGGAKKLDDGARKALAEAAQAAGAVLRFDATKEGDLIVAATAPEAEKAGAAAGQARLDVAKRLGLIDPKKHAGVWIVDYPYFEIDEGQWTLGVVVFTQLAGDAAMKTLLGKRPEDEKHKAKAKGFDLVVDGMELATGYVGNHDLPTQRFIWKEFLKLDHGDLARMRAPIEAFRFGCPPHGEMNIGFDRLVASMLGLDAIDEVMAFPRTYACRDLFLGAPGTAPAVAVAEFIGKEAAAAALAAEQEAARLAAREEQETEA